MKVWLVWSFSTWKSTIAKSLKEKWYNTSEDIEREAIAKFGWIKNQLQFQNYIFERQKQEEEKTSWFFDNTIITVLAYSYFNLDKESYDYLYNKARYYLYKKPYDWLIYLPIEFEIENDWIRNIDKEFQKCIDIKIKYLLKHFDLPYETVKWWVQERVLQITNKYGKTL